MNLIGRLFTRICFRRTIKSDESSNVVDSMVKARKLYKDLCVAVHPDKHLDKRDIAEDLMQRITANKHNYAELLNLKAEFEKKMK